MTNNISFKANIVTKMKGRHNVLENVAKNFEQKTNGINGSLYIYRNKSDYPDSIVFSIDKKTEYIVSNYDELLGNNIPNKSKVTKAYINKVTKTFINIFKALSADQKYDEKISDYEDNIKSVQTAFFKNQKLLKFANEKGETSRAEIYRFLAEQNQKRYLKLKKMVNEEKEKYSKVVEKMANKEPYLEVWRDVIIDDLK